MFLATPDAISYIEQCHPVMNETVGVATMTTVMPQSELMRKAVAWVAEKKAAGEPLAKILDEAGMRFNLSPKDQDFLRDFFKNSGKE